MSWQDKILAESAKITQRDKEKKRNWLVRLVSRLGLKSKDEIEEVLAGTSKHARQRTRPVGYLARKRALQKEREGALHKIVMRNKHSKKLSRNRKQKRARA